MHKKTDGFTLVELLVVIIVVGVLATITIFTFSSVQKNSRDSARKMRAELIATSLENYYQKHGEYPNCSTLTQSSSTVISSTLTDLKTDDLATPTATSGTNSIICGDLNTVNTDSFGYTGDDTCTSSGACTEFTLQYREEYSNSIKSIVSKHRGTYTTLARPNISAHAVSSTQIQVTWDNVSLAQSYTVDWSTSSNFQNYSTAPGLSATTKSYTATSLAQGTTYYFRVSASATGLSTTESLSASATTPIDAPSSPSIAASISGSNAVGTTTAVTCPTGTTAYYSIRSNVNDGSWSDWPQYTTSLSRTISASQGYKYTFQAAARCQTSAATSSASTSSVASAVRSIDAPAAPGWLNGTYYGPSEQFYVNYSSSCPAGTSVVNAQFRSLPWANCGTDDYHYWYNPWGYLDSWKRDTDGDRNVEYWGYYQCATSYTTSPQSAWSYNIVTIGGI